MSLQVRYVPCAICGRPELRLVDTTKPDPTIYCPDCVRLQYFFPRMPKGRD